ncbi:unnamed protein product [Ixodes pacificus]
MLQHAKEGTAFTECGGTCLENGRMRHKIPRGTEHEGKRFLTQLEAHWSIACLPSFLRLGAGGPGPESRRTVQNSTRFGTPSFIPQATDTVKTPQNETAGDAPVPP